MIRRPAIPITDRRFAWIPPDDDAEAFRQRQRERMARVKAEREATEARERAGIVPIKRAKGAGA